MPDGAEKKNKSSAAAAPETEAATIAALDAGAGSGRQKVRGRFSWRLGVFIIVGVAAALFGGREIYFRINYVYAYDSRIDADLITVSSRVAGWVTSLKVTEGSKITRAMVLLTIDSRESTLRLAPLDVKPTHIIRGILEFPAVETLDFARHNITVDEHHGVGFLRVSTSGNGTTQGSNDERRFERSRHAFQISRRTPRISRSRSPTTAFPASRTSS